MICRFLPGSARTDFTPVDNLFISEYLPHAEGLYVQLYLVGLMQCYHPEMADISAADILGVTPQAALEAFCYWQKQGLVRIVKEEPLTVEYQPASQAGMEAPTPAKYAGLIQGVQALLSPRSFGVRELRHVYDWIEVYGLDEDAVLILVRYCLEKRRNIPVTYMTAVAQSWSERGIKSASDAEAYLAGAELSKHGATAILRAWNKRRKPTEDEIARYEKWAGEWGFTQEAILAALPRLSTAGTPNFVYLEDVLSDLKNEGSKSPEAILESDQKDMLERDFAKLLFSRAGKLEPATRTQRSQLTLFMNEYGMSRELMLYAADLSRGAGEPFGVLKKRLSQWHEANIKDIAAAEAYEKSHPLPVAGRPKQRAGQYATRSYSNEGMQHLTVNLDEDLDDD